MAVKIRLRRVGAKKAPFYRVVVADSRFTGAGSSCWASGVRWVWTYQAKK